MGVGLPASEDTFIEIAGFYTQRGRYDVEKSPVSQPPRHLLFNNLAYKARI